MEKKILKAVSILLLFCFLAAMPIYAATESNRELTYCVVEGNTQLSFNSFEEVDVWQKNKSKNKVGLMPRYIPCGNGQHSGPFRSRPEDYVKVYDEKNHLVALYTYTKCGACGTYFLHSIRYF